MLDIVASSPPPSHRFITRPISRVRGKRSSARNDDRFCLDGGRVAALHLRSRSQRPGGGRSGGGRTNRKSSRTLLLMRFRWERVSWLAVGLGSMVSACLLSGETARSG